MNQTVIRTEGLVRRFGRVLAVDHVTLAVPPGAIYALVGANGAGKTTLIKLLVNILRPSSGQAQVLGTDSRRIAGKIFERIGYVSENQQFPEGMTVGGMLAYLRTFYPAWDSEAEQRLVRQFDLQVDRKLKHLSRGMRMKAAVASSLAYHPALIILDEPFSGLDPLVRDELVETLAESAAQETTVFVSSHDLAEIENLASHIGFLQEGRLLFSQETEAMNERFREVSITLDTAPPLRDLPATWLQPQASEHVLSFVHSDFKGYESQRELTERFPAASNISVEPMPLRSIFLAIAKANKNRVAAEQTHAATEESVA